MNPNFKVFLLAFCISSSFCTYSQNWNWAVNISSPEVQDMAVDNAGNVYLAHSAHCAISKYDADGKMVWRKQSLNSISFSRGLAVDKDNNLYVTGHGSNTEWDGQNINHIVTQTGFCLFVMKIDPNGQIIWSTTVPNKTGGTFAAYDIEVDEEGSSYIHGLVGNSLAMTSRLNPNGTEAWYRTMSGPNYASGPGAIDLDVMGNCYVTSHFGTNWYDKSMLIAKYNPAGSLVWKNIVPEYLGLGIAVQSNGSFFITASAVNSSKEGKYLQMFDSSGKSIWVSDRIRHIGNGVEADYKNNSYCVGTNSDSALHNFIAKFDPVGKEIWKLNISSTGNASARFIKSTRMNSSCYVTGAFNDTIVFGNTTLITFSDAIYLAKLDCDFALPLPAGSNPMFYPNPFNQTSTLVFENSKHIPHDLSIYDSQGKLVQTIRNISTSQILVDRKTMTCGVYCYVLRDPTHVVGEGKFIIE